MGKRKPTSNHDNQEDEAGSKKQKKQTGIEKNVSNHSNDTGLQDNNRNKKKSGKTKSKPNNNSSKNKKKVKGKKKDGVEQRTVSMHDILQEKLKKAQLHRQEKSVEKPGMIKPDLEKMHDSPNIEDRIPVKAQSLNQTTQGKFEGENKKASRVNLDDTSKTNSSAETSKENKKKSKKSKQDSRKSIEGPKKENVVGPTDNVEEEIDPEKAAIREKKREKRKLKKLEKARLKQELKDKAGTAKISAIDYLNQWKNNKDEWKFLKVRQVWLLQNLYDETLVKDESFEILLEYLEGLKGRSRESTVEDAEKVMAQTDDETSATKCERARQVIQLLS